MLVKKRMHPRLSAVNRRLSGNRGTKMFGLGPWEIAIILLVVLLLFGGRKIPQLAKDLGSGIREFKKSVSDTSQALEDNSDYEEEKPRRAAPKKKRSRKS